MKRSFLKTKRPILYDRVTRALETVLAVIMMAASPANAADRIPQTVEDLWADFPALDKATPLDAEILKTWEEDGVVMNIVRFNVGKFGGQMLKVAGYYAYPKGGKNLPALVQCNGGGQKASASGPLKWARDGYACFNPNNGAQPWDKDGQGLPNTDWGSFNPGIRKPDKRDGKGTLAPGPGTVDKVVSPRNQEWYLRIVGMRRALTFLQSRPEVNPDKLGVRGHSTGGVMTVYTAVDPRVKAAVPSVGGCGFWWDDAPFGEKYPFVMGNLRPTGGMDAAERQLFLNTISCDAHWKIMKCPVLFLGASDDFNSPTDNVVRSLNAVKHDEKRLVLAPHYNHSFDPASAIADVMWFEDHLKGAFKFPKTPESTLQLKTADGVPVVQVKPDPTCKLPIAAVDIFYSYERHPLLRFWADAGAVGKDGVWQGRCPTFYADEPLFVFANVTYKIDPKLPGETATELNVTSAYHSATPDQLAAAGVKPSEKPQRLVDDFDRGLHDWIGNLEKPRGWEIQTHKLCDPRWAGPKGGELVFEFFSPAARNHVGIMVNRRFRNQNNGAFSYYAIIPLPEKGWNTIRMKPEQLVNIFGEKLDDWNKVILLGIGDPANYVKKMEKKGGKDAAALPATSSSWSSSYYQSSSDAYAKDNIEGKSSNVTKHIRNVRWEGGEYAPRAKPWQPEGADKKNKQPQE